MTAVLHRLSRPALEGLATALECGRAQPPFTGAQLRGHVPDGMREEVAAWLAGRHAEGLSVAHAAMLLRLLAEERGSTQTVADRVQLVWSGTDVPGSTTRDTAVVVQELFRSARRSVLIASYALDHGEKAAAIFGLLARRLDAEPSLDVRLYVNVHRGHDETRSPAELVREFSERFRHEIWMGKRLPAVYYDPRALNPGGDTRACLHAKCIVVDGERAFISSANFTEAAHVRNIEAGVLLADPGVASALQAQFHALVTRGLLCRLP